MKYYHNNYNIENLFYLDKEGIIKYEEFKDIPKLEGFYKISNLGRVKSLNYNKTNKEKIMKAGIDKDGYLYLQLKKLKYKIHRLVALTFIPNPENKPTVNHIDEDKLLNIFYNLEWATVDEQNKHSKGIPVNILINGKLKIFKSLREAGKELKLDKGTIKRRYLS